MQSKLLMTQKGPYLIWLKGHSAWNIYNSRKKVKTKGEFKIWGKRPILHKRTPFLMSVIFQELALHQKWNFLLRISSVNQKSSMENFIFCAVLLSENIHRTTSQFKLKNGNTRTICELWKELSPVFPLVTLNQ